MLERCNYLGERKFNKMKNRNYEGMNYGIITYITKKLHFHQKGFITHDIGQFCSNFNTDKYRGDHNYFAMNIVQ